MYAPRLSQGWLKYVFFSSTFFVATFLFAILYIMHMTSRPDFNFHFQDCTSSNECCNMSPNTSPHNTGYTN